MTEALQATVEPSGTPETLAAMRRGLSRTTDRFALYLAVSNSPRWSRELIRLLADGVPGVEVVELPHGVEDPLVSIGERIDPDGSGPLMVLGLERSLSTDVLDAPLLRVLNMQRERWPATLPRPVVLWVPEFALELLGRSAPDFLDWRSDTFHFDEDAPSSAEGELRAMDAALWKDGLDEGLPVGDRRRRIEELRSRLASTSETSDPRILSARANWFHELGVHHLRIGEWNSGSSCFAESLAIDQELGNRPGIASSYHQLGTVAEHRGDYDDALDWYRKSLAISEELGNRPGIASTYHQLGTIAEERGDYDDALDWYRKSLAIKEELGNRAGVANSYHQLGTVAQRRGDHSDALDWYRKSLAIKEELGNRAGMANSYHQLGMVAEERGDYDDALDWYRKSLAIDEELGNRAGMAISYHQLGTVAQRRGDHDDALDWYRESLAIKEELGDRAGIARSLSQIGILWTERGEPEKALPLNLQSLALRLELLVPEVAIDLYWLSQQRDLLGEPRFCELVEQEIGEAAEQVFDLLARFEADRGSAAPSTPPSPPPSSLP